MMIMKIMSSLEAYADSGHISEPYIALDLNQSDLSILNEDFNQNHKKPYRY